MFLLGTVANLHPQRAVLRVGSQPRWTNDGADASPSATTLGLANEKTALTMIVITIVIIVVVVADVVIVVALVVSFEVPSSSSAGSNHAP